MRFKVEKAPLVNALQDLVSIVPAKTTLQVLTNFLLVAKGDELAISATDLDISMKTLLKVKGEKDGELTVNARKFFEIIRELPSGNVQIEAVNNVLQISSEKKFSCKIAGADTADFPAPPEVDAAMEFELPSHVIRRLAEKTVFAVAEDGARRSLNGIYWDIREKEMIMVATDGHKLGYSSYHHSINAKGGKNLILSPKAINHFLRLLPADQEENVGICIGSNYVSFVSGVSTIVSKLIPGPYPNYEQVIPKANNKKVGVDREELAAAIRRVSILSSVKTHQVKFAFKPNLLELSAVNRDFGAEAKEEIPVTYTAEDLEIGFNASFFLEILRLTDTPRVVLSLNSALSATLLHPETEDKKEGDYFFLLMPLRLLNER